MLHGSGMTHVGNRWSWLAGSGTIGSHDAQPNGDSWCGIVAHVAGGDARRTKRLSQVGGTVRDIPLDETVGALLNRIRGETQPASGSALLVGACRGGLRCRHSPSNGVAALSAQKNKQIHGITKTNASRRWVSTSSAAGPVRRGRGTALDPVQGVTGLTGQAVMARQQTSRSQSTTSNCPERLCRAGPRANHRYASCRRHPNACGRSRNCEAGHPKIPVTTGRWAAKLATDRYTAADYGEGAGCNCRIAVACKDHKRMPDVLPVQQTQRLDARVAKEKLSGLALLRPHPEPNPEQLIHRDAAAGERDFRCESVLGERLGRKP
jgi:hypothetical protein